MDCYVKCQAGQFPYQGQKNFLRFPSVGATENAILVACAATSETIIYNVAMEPEIVDMVVLLNSMGARITGAGTSEIRIRPVFGTLKRVAHEVIPDRLEAGTFLFMMAATKGTVKNVIPDHLISTVSVLLDSGIKIAVNETSISIDATRSEPKSFDIDALPFSGFPTDLQPFASVYANVCMAVQRLKIFGLHTVLAIYLKYLK